MRARRLTVGERALAFGIFGAALDLDPVRLATAPRPWSRTFVAGRWFGRHWVIYPTGELVGDFCAPGAPLESQATLIHELTHVWQAQQGVNLLFAKLKAGDGREAYAYWRDGYREWNDLNIEQQATLIEHRLLARRGVVTPWPLQMLEHIPPFGCAGG
ncbi:MAG: hypothetical protein JSR45_05350 [Proteobacteria bacterium]|nr:hypothetical protein [Pseudomonadota bacterium]